MRGDERARVFLAPIATPLPLTFLGLLIATLILSGLELGWIPETETHQAGWALLAVPIPLQLTAAIFGFHGRSATAATGSSVLAAAWLGISLNLIASRPGSFTPSHAVGMLAFAVAAALFVPAAAALRAGAPMPAVTLTAASARFALTGVVAMTQSTGLRTASGVAGCVVAA